LGARHHLAGRHRFRLRADPPGGRAAGARPGHRGTRARGRADLQPTKPESAMATTPARHPASHWGRVAAGVVVAWVLILGVIVGIGKLLMVTKNGNGNVLGDRTIPHWFAAHRTPNLTHWSGIFSTLGATQALLITGMATCVV